MDPRSDLTTRTDATSVLSVRVQPGSARDAVTAVAVDPPSLTVRVRARAHDGEANAAAIRVLSGALGLPRAAVTIWRGAAARNKLVRVDLAPADLQSRLATILKTIQPRKTGS